LAFSNSTVFFIPPPKYRNNLKMDPFSPKESSLQTQNGDTHNAMDSKQNGGSPTKLFVPLGQMLFDDVMEEESTANNDITMESYGKLSI
jgi:hypothetical protein